MWILPLEMFSDYGYLLGGSYFAIVWEIWKQILPQFFLRTPDLHLDNDLCFEKDIWSL